MDQPQAQSVGMQERRESFRVEDVLPLLCRQLPPDLPCPRSRLIPGISVDYAAAASCEEPSEQGVSPQLWRMLNQINERLGLILRRLDLEADGLTKAESRQVSLSASGVKFTTEEAFEPGTRLEVKILLPLDPALWLVAYGDVVRRETYGDGQFGTAVRFDELDETVIEAINHYGLKRQRELIRKRKGL